MFLEKLSANLKLLMEEKLINASELARQTGLPASSIKKIRNNDNPNPTLTTLLPLANYFSITLSQLIGEVSLSSQQTNFKNSRTILNDIPILTNKEVIDWPNTYLLPHPTVQTEKKYSKYAFALKEDDEFELRKGTIFFFDPIIKPVHGDHILVYKNPNLPNVKQILWDEEYIYLKPLISGFSIIPFTKDHKIIGVMMEYRKEIKKVPMLEHDIDHSLI